MNILQVYSPHLSNVARNHENRLIFDRVIQKIKRWTFFWGGHSVFGHQAYAKAKARYFCPRVVLEVEDSPRGPHPWLLHHTKCFTPQYRRNIQVTDLSAFARTTSAGGPHTLERADDKSPAGPTSETQSSAIVSVQQRINLYIAVNAGENNRSK